jgi:hypothetical protein
MNPAPTEDTFGDPIGEFTTTDTLWAVKVDTKANGIPGAARPRLRRRDRRHEAAGVVASESARCPTLPDAPGGRHHTWPVDGSPAYGLIAADQATAGDQQRSATTVETVSPVQMLIIEPEGVRFRP